ncbi:MAG: ABC transporter ATP-binding protein [Parcubacteria group bacterium]
MKVIWSYLKPFKKTFWFLSFLAVLSSIINAGIPYLYGRLVDLALHKTALTLIFQLLALWFVAALVNNLLVRSRNYRADLLSANVSNSIINNFLRHIIRLPLSFHKNQKTGKIMSRLERAAFGMEGVIEGIIFSTLPGFLTIAIILTVLFFLSWLLTLLLIAVLLIYVVVTVKNTKVVIVSHKQLNNAYDRVFGDFWEYASSVHTIKAFSAENSIFAIIRRYLSLIMSRRQKHAINISNLDFWQQAIFGLGFVVMFGVSVLLLSTQKMSAGNLVMFVGYINLIYQPLAYLAQNYRQFRRCLATLEKVHKMENLPLEVQMRRKNLVELEKVSGEVEFQNIWFKYQQNKNPWVLKDINFKVNQGELIALVGRSGVGKSTLVDLIASFNLPSKGDVLIDGISVRNISGENLRRFVGLVPQEVVLFHETIWFNLRFGNPDATDEEIITAAKQAHAHEFIMKFPKGYDAKVGERGVKLSVGQKQRVAIARAILHKPAILILDEATASLDSMTEHLVQEALQYLVKGKTTFVIAHRLSTIKNADRIFVFDKGRLAQIGKHNELINVDGVYKNLCAGQKF